jgi:hypothetical protein
MTTQNKGLLLLDHTHKALVLSLLGAERLELDQIWQRSMLTTTSRSLHTRHTQKLSSLDYSLNSFRHLQ